MEYNTQIQQQNNNNQQNKLDFTNIEDLPVNPQKSGEQPSVISDPVNKMNQTNAIQDCLEFPEEFKTDLNNIVIDNKATPTYSAEKEEITNEKRVKFNLPQQNEVYNEEEHLNNLYVNNITNKYNSLTPLVQMIILSSILYFILSNPIVQEFIITFINNINIVKITNNDGNINLFGKILFSLIFGSTLFFIVQAIHSSSLQIVF